MTAMHLSECGKEKFKTGTSFPSFDGLGINCPSDVHKREPEYVVIATRLQLRAKRGRGEADAAIQNASSLRGGEADVAIQMANQNASLSCWIASLRSQ